MSQSRQRNTKRVTIKDVAQAAGVSVTTVSNVLNNRTEAMTEKTLLRIQETIRLLNYRPSSVARSLVTSYTATIGVIIAEIETPLFLQALNVIELSARSTDHNILLCTAHNLDDEKQSVNLLLQKQVDGIIFLSNSVYLDDDYLVHLPSSAPPIVLINRATIQDRFDQINWDNTGGVMAAVEYLVKLGHRRIAHLLGPANRRSTEERFQGYSHGLKQHGLEYIEDYVREADYGAPQETWEQAVLELFSLSPRPTAVIASDDTVAAMVMRMVQRAGLRVPQDTAVVGIDNQPLCTYLNPTLTTVGLPIIEAGKRAIEFLLARIANQGETIERVTLPCPLIVRESSQTI